MREYSVENDEAVLILGSDRIELHSPMMDDPSGITFPIPEHIRFAQVLVYLIKTDIDFREWVTSKYWDLVEEWMEKETD